MSVNSQLLVLRRDSATGITQVGWASELPLGRFIHIDTIAASAVCAPIYTGSPLYADYLNACRRAQQLNEPELQKQRRTNRANGWYPVPLNLNGHQASIQPDPCGIYQLCAQQAKFRLSGDCNAVWAGITRNRVTHILSRRPHRLMHELEYQVWKHHLLHILSQQAERIIRGDLVVQDSGLWFKPLRDGETVFPSAVCPADT